MKKQKPSWCIYQTTVGAWEWKVHTLHGTACLSSVFAAGSASTWEAARNKVVAAIVCTNNDIPWYEPAAQVESK